MKKQKETLSSISCPKLWKSKQNGINENLENNSYFQKKKWILILFVLILTLFMTNCSILESQESCNFKNEGICYNILDLGNVKSADFNTWCKNLEGEYKEESCSKDGSVDICTNIKSEDYNEIIDEEKSKGNIKELEFYFYKTEIVVPIKSTQKISYKNYTDFCTDIEGEILTDE